MDPFILKILDKVMWVFFNCLGISVYHVLYERVLHLRNCSPSGPLTSYIRDSTNVLTTQTNYEVELCSDLYKQNRFLSLSTSFRQLT